MYVSVDKYCFFTKIPIKLQQYTQGLISCNYANVWVKMIKVTAGDTARGREMSHFPPLLAGEQKSVACSM